MSRSSTPALPLYNLSNGPSRLQPPQVPTESRSPSRTRNRQASQAATSVYAFMTADDTAQKLSSSLTHGISSAEANSRVLQHGPNELPREVPEPLWLRFVKQFQETLILLLLGSAAVSLIMGQYEDAISIAAAVIIVVTVGFVQEYRSEKSLEALNRLVPHYAHLIRRENSTGEDGVATKVIQQHATAEGQVTAAKNVSATVSAVQLVPGDLVLFYTGDRIPADIRITRSADLTVDESNLTGENEPVRKSPDIIDMSSFSNGTFERADASSGGSLRVSEQTNIAFMGTLVRSGYGQGLVIGTGGNTEFGAVSASLQEIESPRTPLQVSMDRLGKDLSYMSFGVIAFIMLLGLWRGWKLLDMFQIGVSLAVAAIPEGLPIIVTVTLALGVFRMSKKNAIVRRLPSVETLGSVNVICSDKTGTLTMNHQTVTKLWHSDIPSPVEVDKLRKSETLDPAIRKILRIGNIANDGRLSDTRAGRGSGSGASAVMASTLGDESVSIQSRWLGQPTDVALLDLVDVFGEDDIRERIGERINEVPFSSERKWMGVAIRSVSSSGNSAQSDHGYIKGALEQVLKRCDSYVSKDGRETVLDEAARKRTLAAAESMAREGLRVLAVASGPIATQAKAKGTSAKDINETSTPRTMSPFLKSGSNPDDAYKGLVFAGLVGMNDPPRKDVSRSIRRLMAGGVKVIMITGDSETTAVAIGKQLGMPINMNSAVGKAVIRGDELDNMSDEELSQSITTANIFARTTPEHKMQIIRALQARGDVVAMTGDGVNDAPALKKADIGVSMGRHGTDVAKEAADMILTDDDFSTILNAIEEGKAIFSNIQNFLTFQLSTSAAALSLVFFSTFFGFRNPLNAMQILWINILMDGPPAQSLGVEPVDPAVMNRPPRSRHARVLTRALIQRVLQSASIIMLGTILTYIHEMSNDGQVSARDTTMTFTCFVLFDMFNALTCRSESKSVLRGEIGLFSNKMFNYAVAGSLIGQATVIYFPVAQKIFQTEALGFFDLVRLVIIASCVFWVDEGRKFVKRQRSQGRIGGYSSSV